MTPGRPTDSSWLSRKRLGVGAGVLVFVIVLSVGSLSWLDRNYPPPLDEAQDYSVEVLDRNGEPLRIFTNSEGRWRLPAKLDEVDPKFIKMLIAYEDKRFYDHHGVDPLAMMRAAWQFASSGRIISGGSTITMQLARLLEPRAQRSIPAKLRQIARAFQIEQRLTKEEILERYLTLAPYGGNIEGIRAASLSWFDREPETLAMREAALLVALPQSPERRRPDRFPVEAKDARDRVLQRLTEAGIVPEGEVERVARLAAPAGRHPMPMLAPHLASDAIDRNPLAHLHETTLDRALQQRIERVAADAARKIGKRVSVAIVVADGWNGEILASVGSPGIDDTARQGWIDMTRALRSPGSTLKPFVYGLAIEDGLVLPETMVSDRPSDFGGYRPTNFDTTYQGDVSVRKALQMSLNVPAVQLLDAVSPARFMGRLKRAHVEPQTPDERKPGLSLVLGGASQSLTDLVQLYANLVNRGNRPILLGDGIHAQAGTGEGTGMLSPVAAWHVIDMLKGIREPVGSKPLPVAYKTGTSYGYRDAWSIGFDGRHVIGVWVGRADNGSVPGITGIKTAAPILFEALDQFGSELTPFRDAPAGAVRREREKLPVALKSFDNVPVRERFANVSARDRLKVAFPADGSEIELASSAEGKALPVVIRLQGGVPPFRLIEEQTPAVASRRRELYWEPGGAGFFRLSVLDAVGQIQTVNIRIN
jgi:penicillin-binding protein 1C